MFQVLGHNKNNNKFNWKYFPYLLLVYILGNLLLGLLPLLLQFFLVTFIFFLGEKIDGEDIPLNAVSLPPFQIQTNNNPTQETTCIAVSFAHNFNSKLAYMLSNHPKT